MSSYPGDQRYADEQDAKRRERAAAMRLTPLEAFLYRLTRDYGVPLYAVLDHSVTDRDGAVTNETVRDEARAFAKVLLGEKGKP